VEIDPGVFLIGFITVVLALALYLGKKPVSGRVETTITQKRVRFQETMIPSGNAYVPTKSEVFTIDTEISYDIPVSKSLWDKLDTGEKVELDKHLDGTFSYRRRIKV
jgi:hypothetical protein